MTRFTSLLLALLVSLFAITGCGEDPVDGNQSNDGNHANDGNQNNDTQNNDTQNSNQNNDNQCTDACTEGDTRCSGDGVQTCVSVGGCGTWADAVDCGDDLVCSGGECVDECTDACDDGDMECDGDSGFRVCEEQSSGCLDWSPAESCPDATVCNDGICEGCTDGQLQCSADNSEVQECTDGAWSGIQSCPVGCDNAECVTEVACSPGDYRCSGDVVEMCNATGTAYLYIATCAVACDNGLCTGDCEPGDQRCNGDNVEVCNSAGTAWDVEDTCTDTSCDPMIAACALEELDITSDTDLDGTIVVEGPFTVRAGASVTSPSGELRIYATSITVEEGASIYIDSTGANPVGNGNHYSSAGRGGTGGSYATAGSVGYYSIPSPPAAHGRDDDTVVVKGSRGGHGHSNNSLDTSLAGMGGGVLHLIADQITVAGSLRADGEDGQMGSAFYCGDRSGGGGGTGGGILLAADDLTFSGTASVVGGTGASDNCNWNSGGDGGDGLIKFLHGVSFDHTGTVQGVEYSGLLAPLNISSTTHPDRERFYNDDFDTVAISWNRPFDSLQGYYENLNAQQFFVPGPSNANFLADEVHTYPRSALVDGPNYFHITPINAQSTVGQMESRFPINVNTLPPTPSSSSHTNSDSWYSNPNVYIQWADQRPDSNFTGYYYRVDNFGDTVPDESDNYLPVDQKQVLLADQPDGIWAFHIVPVDTMGYLTKEAGTYRFQLGDDPGTGNILGTVRDEDNNTLQGATVTINRGLLNPTVADQVSDNNGAYNFGTVPAGEWELRVSAEGYETKYHTVTLDDGQNRTVDFTLDPQ